MVIVGIAINIASIYVHRWAGFGGRTLLLTLFRLKDADDARVARDAQAVRDSDVVRTAFISRQIAASTYAVLALLTGTLFLAEMTIAPPGKNPATSMTIALGCMFLAVLNVFRAQYFQLVIQKAASSPQSKESK